VVNKNIYLFYSFLFFCAVNINYAIDRKEAQDIVVKSMIGATAGAVSFYLFQNIIAPYVLDPTLNWGLDTYYNKKFNQLTPEEQQKILDEKSKLHKRYEDSQKKRYVIITNNEELVIREAKAAVREKELNNREDAVVIRANELNISQANREESQKNLNYIGELRKVTTNIQALQELAKREDYEIIMWAQKR